MSDLSCPQWRNSQPLHGPLTISSLQLSGHQGLDTQTAKNYSQWSVFYLCVLFSTNIIVLLRVCVCVYYVCLRKHLCLRDELRDLLAGIERCHLHVGHTPVSTTRGVQDLVMFLQDLTETSEVQVLLMTRQHKSIHGLTQEIITLKTTSFLSLMHCYNASYFYEELFSSMYICVCAETW